MLMAGGPRGAASSVFVHGFLLGADGRKMSKSLGNVLDPLRGASSATAPTRCASTCCATSSSAATGRSAWTAFAVALRGRARQRVRQPREPDAQHDRALLRRRRPRRRDRRARCAQEFVGAVRRGSTSCSTAPSCRRARGDLAAGAAPEPLRRGDARPGRSRATKSARRELASVLASLAEGLRVVTVALAPYMPAKTATLLDALGAAQPGERAFAERRAGARPVTAIAAAVPEAPRDRLATPTSTPASRRTRELVAARAQAAGVTRILTVGTDAASCRAALAAAERFPEVSRPRSAATRTTPGELDAELAARARDRTRAASRSARRASTTTATARPRDDQRRAFEAPDRPRARARQAARDPHARGREDTLELLERRAAGLEVILHCFSMPEHLDRCVAGRLVDLVRRQRHLPEPTRARRGRGRACPLSACSSRPTRRTSRRSRGAGSPTSPPPSSRRRGSSPTLRGVAPRSSRRELERNAAALFDW